MAYSTSIKRRRAGCFYEIWIEMSRFWSRLTHDLRPYLPGEQPRMAGLVKLNTNESPFGPSPRALEAIRGEATDGLRLYPDPEAIALRAALATYHKVRPRTGVRR